MLPAINIPTPYNTIQTQKAIIENLEQKLQQMQKRMNSMKSGCQGLSDATLDQLLQQVSLYSDDEILRAIKRSDRINRVIGKAVEKRVRKNEAEYTFSFVRENIYAMMAALCIGFGFGKVRLERFLRTYENIVTELQQYYAFETCSDIQPECQKIVEAHGFSMADYEKKYGVRYGTDDKPK